MERIEPSDVVLHKPSGEKWVICGVNYEQGKVIPCGFPFPTLGKLEDCELIEKYEGSDKQPDGWIDALKSRGFDHFIYKTT